VRRGRSAELPSEFQKTKAPREWPDAARLLAEIAGHIRSLLVWTNLAASADDGGIALGQIALTPPAHGPERRSPFSQILANGQSLQDVK